MTLKTADQLTNEHDLYSEQRLFSQALKSDTLSETKKTDHHQKSYESIIKSKPSSRNRKKPLKYKPGLESTDHLDLPLNQPSYRNQLLNPPQPYPQSTTLAQGSGYTNTNHLPINQASYQASYHPSYHAQLHHPPQPYPQSTTLAQGSGYRVEEFRTHQPLAQTADYFSQNLQGNYHVSCINSLTSRYRYYRNQALRDLQSDSQKPTSLQLPSERTNSGRNNHSEFFSQSSDTRKRPRMATDQGQLLSDESRLQSQLSGELSEHISESSHTNFKKPANAEEVFGTEILQPKSFSNQPSNPHLPKPQASYPALDHQELAIYSQRQRPHILNYQQNSQDHRQEINHGTNQKYDLGQTSFPPISLQSELLASNHNPQEQVFDRALQNLYHKEFSQQRARDQQQIPKSQIALSSQSQAQSLKTDDRIKVHKLIN